MTMSYAAEDRQRSAIRRITEGPRRWRVLVEAWPEQDEFRGRLLFHPEGTLSWAGGRESTALLQGHTMEDVVSRAYDLSEERLRRLLHSFG